MPTEPNPQPDDLDTRATDYLYALLLGSLGASK